MSQEKPLSEEQTLKTLPTDDVRAIMWRFADRYDLQMLVQSTRAVARGPVARLVAAGGRNSHEWTAEKEALLKHFDESGITAAFLEPEYGGFIEGPKNLATSLVAFELSWVDAGAATCSLASNLALAPIHERGTPEQNAHYQRAMAPPQPGEDRKPMRGAFALTEPLPFVGVDTGFMSGRISVAEWEEGKEPILLVEKRGRFITNMAFANYVTVAVDTADPRIKSSCMVIVEETDPGVFDRGTPAKKLVHQLSSTRDPIISVRVPASRIIGGYDIVDGVIVPRYNHSEVIEAVFRRTRVTVALMTAAKLLSAVEPVIRYQRQRFRGGNVGPGSPRYDLGLQGKEDSLHRLVDVWAMGEAAASLGFSAARAFDVFDPLEKQKEKILAEKGIKGGRAELRALREVEKKAIELIALEGKPADQRDAARYEELKSDPLVQYVLLDAETNVLCPASKLWCGFGANAMREAVSLMGGYGITEDCPGFLGQKWMDAQLEATYEGPEAVQRRQLSVTMTSPVFLALWDLWTKQLREIACRRPGTGACTLATAMTLWRWTLHHLTEARDAHGQLLYQSARQGVTFALADALAWLLASRQQILDVLELEEKGPSCPTLAEGLEGYVQFFTDLCHVQAARAAGECGRICAELVHGYNAHPAWETVPCNSCYSVDEVNDWEAILPGLPCGAEEEQAVYDKEHVLPKAGPCVRFGGLEQFERLRMKLDGCLTGARLAKDRAAKALTQVMIPEALDYPQ
ncbi:MAG: acyl-CoA/acyl-ACP dehydrogenase [Candidatus Sumerlaeaceae bacterium]|nr:acyl-CoA/acyl-ACP dehydrogenase [Candidatus Sumerlaeaceae bacterium]